MLSEVLTGEPAATSADPRGLFVGLATLDMVYRVPEHPGPNRKVVAVRQDLAAGGPAANAAVTFAALGGAARLVTGLGAHPLGRFAAAELAGRGVVVRDTAMEWAEPPAVASILVQDSTGERAVVSTHAAGMTVTPPDDLAVEVAKADVLLVDGHHPALALPAARAAAEAGVPVILDGGSWKLATEKLLPYVTVAACSADFRVPGCASPPEAARALARYGVVTVLVTRGPDPVLWWSGGWSGSVPVPQVVARDTLGAGDVFHGALCWAVALGADVVVPEAAVRFAAAVAALRCSIVGPRAWLDDPALAELARSFPKGFPG